MAEDTWTAPWETDVVLTVEFSYPSLGFSLVSSQGCMGKWLGPQALNADRYVLYNSHGGILKTTNKSLTQQTMWARGSTAS